MHTPSSARKTIACRIPGSPARTWRCHRCGAVLGVEQDGELHVKYKDCQHWISGRCRHPCRRCGAMNTLDVAAPPPSVACTNTSVESQSETIFQGEAPDAHRPGALWAKQNIAGQR